MSAKALHHCARAVRRTRRQALEGERRAVADGGERGAEVVVVYGGDLGFGGDQPRDAHDLGVVAGVVAEASGGEDYAGERRSLRVAERFEFGGVLVAESLAIPAPESLGAARLELRL